jgi:hypothetical protein
MERNVEMLQSQFNLDHRLAELRQIGVELRLVQAANESARPARGVGATIRAFLGWAPAPARPARLEAH